MSESQFPAYGHQVPDANPDLEGWRVAERDARMGAYRDRERRRAAVALDRYLEALYGTPPGVWTQAARAAGERFVEQVGDYVLSRLHNNGHYGVSLVGPLCVHGFVADGQACGEFGCTEPAPRNPDYGAPDEYPVSACPGTPHRKHVRGADPCPLDSPQAVDNDRFPSAGDVQQERFQ